MSYPPNPPQQYPGAAQYPPPGTAPYAPETRRSRTPLYVGIAVVVLAAIAAGVYFGFLRGGSNGYATPAKAADALMKAAQARDVGAVQDALCAGDRALASQFTTQDSGGTLKSYAIGTTTHQDGAHATVHVDVVTTEGKDSTDLPVTKESDGWLVCVSDLLRQLPTSIPTG